MDWKPLGGVSICSALCLFFTVIITAVGAAVLPRQIGQNVPARDWQSAVQNINGLNSVLTLLPVLTGKVQNVKLVACRIYPASFVVAGVGAGRVLSKLQVGILLWSFELYRNTVGELSYAHDEYVNKFSPTLEHIPTGTAERHSTSLIINHNPAEVYMVEAWFRTRGVPSIIKLKQNNYIRLALGSFIYLLLYGAETFLAVQNGADGTTKLLCAVQAICVSAWLSAVVTVQVVRGQGNPEIELNRLESPEYRCLRMPTLGTNVICETFSFHVANLTEFKLYGAKYEQPVLSVAGVLILTSATLDIISTVLIVGLTSWAYPWIGFEVVVILIKVVFCIEPMREIEIASARPHGGNAHQNPQITNPVTLPALLPLKIQLADPFTCSFVSTDYNVFREANAGREWRSTSAGVSIGQTYTAVGDDGSPLTKCLAHTQDGKLLSLADDPPTPQSNEALQREFLAALSVVVEANRVPSVEFVTAIERTLCQVESTMEPSWYAFGAKDVTDRVKKARRDLHWRRFL
ncbi:hypothetical protein PV08_10935 [Exophiala spinifera]|uniref:Uncharacterized protein n=1 Tax=Exophiala spinifera TaxID=91928 RepID=A0A0D2AY52_9EURO|nr:uncharacterized protein PV08_10935 [Exophiala spinifera]KIW11633.1 hypothetical protein PV08_10935 [Exophiala spinifera]